MEPLSRMALAAARTPGAAFLRGDDLGGAPTRAWLALGPTTLVSVAPEHPERGLEAWSSALDGLRGGARGESPVAFGWLSYDAARGVMDPRPHGDGAPCAWLARYAHVLALDTVTGSLTWPEDPVGRAALEAALERAEEPPESAPFDLAGGFTREAHARAIEAVREGIRRGEVYLVNVAQVLQGPPRGDLDALAARVLASGARYGSLLRAGEVTVAGMSMELGLSWDRTGGVAVTRPIKGTRPRRERPDDDAREARDLAADPKERAENAMAVDVHRNDLGRVARTGSVEVPALCAVEPHRFVHHLVSTVRAAVPGATPARDVLAATLPVGSVTGAPKLAAMSLISRLEPLRRGVYTGVYGCVFGDGSLQLAVAIRTLVADALGVHYGVGGGIVWDSEPAREWEELTWKLRTVRGG